MGHWNCISDRTYQFFLHLSIHYYPYLLYSHFIFLGGKGVVVGGGKTTRSLDGPVKDRYHGGEVSVRVYIIQEHYTILIFYMRLPSIQTHTRRSQISPATNRNLFCTPQLLLLPPFPSSPLSLFPFFLLIGTDQLWQQHQSQKPLERYSLASHLIRVIINPKSQIPNQIRNQ